MTVCPNCEPENEHASRFRGSRSAPGAQVSEGGLEGTSIGPIQDPRTACCGKDVPCTAISVEM